VKLSILICTIPERMDKFNALISELDRQINECGGSVQIISDNRKRKEVSVGKKRDDLLNLSIGEYCVFIDDDDGVPPYYVSEILKAIELKTDCIGFDIECDIEGKKENACARMHYNWEDNKDGFRYVRSIYHKTPVKTSIAKQVGFKDMRFGEDFDYSTRLKPYLSSEYYIKKIMYFYNYKYQNPKIKYGL
jgi:hypothetical protein